MESLAARAQARRVFEETLQCVQARYQCTEDVMVDATAIDALGQRILVARYKCHQDGHVECFEVLNEVLWPSL